MSDSAGDRLVAWSIGGAVLLQGANLVLMGRLGVVAALQLMVVTLALAVLAAQGWRLRMALNHRVDMLLVMASFGGLGMLLGWWVDLGFTAPLAAGMHGAMGHGGAAAGHHAGHGGSLLAAATSWMTAGMLAGAIPPALMLTRCAELARGSWRRWVSTHIVGNVAMVLGMIVVGRWLGMAVGRLVGSPIVGAHLAMMAGMLVGMEAGMYVGEAALGLKPWREWTWRAERRDSAASSLRSS